MSDSENKDTVKVKRKIGLASASKETRHMVAKKGGTAPHALRGLAAADPETRERVAREGGKARALDKIGLTKAGEKGGKAVKEKYGFLFYSELGRKGGKAVKEKYGSAYFSKIAKEGNEGRRRKKNKLVDQV